MNMLNGTMKIVMPELLMFVKWTKVSDKVYFFKTVSLRSESENN